MHVGVCIYMCMRIYVYIYVWYLCTCICVCTCNHTQIHSICVHLPDYVYVCINMLIYVHTHMYVYTGKAHTKAKSQKDIYLRRIYTCIWSCICGSTCIYRHIHTYTYKWYVITYIYILTYTNMYVQARRKQKRFFNWILASTSIPTRWPICFNFFPPFWTTKFPTTTRWFLI